MARRKKDNMEKFNSPFAKNIRKLMEERRITQDEIAIAITRTRQTVSQYVNGVSEPGYDTLIKIAKYLGVSTDYLLGNAEEKTPETDARAVISYTGLSEENVKTLHDMASSLGGPVRASKDANIALLDGNKPFIDCLNDLLESVYADRDTIMKHYIRLRRTAMKNETVDFWYVIGASRPIAGFEPMEYTNLKAQIPFNNEQVEYLCSKIAKAIESSLLRKYFATSEDISRLEKDIDDEKLRNEMLRKQLEEGRNNGID